MNRHRIMVAPLVALFATACAPFALSPPARTLPLESSATLDDGRLAIQAAGGGHESLGIAGGAASARLRYGAAEHVEAQAEVSYAHVGYRDDRSPHLGSGRIGLKLAPIEHIAFVAGIGAGSHAYGAFVAPDAGVIIAYENRYLVPWVAFRGAVSLPVAATAITVTQTRTDGTMESFVLVPPDTAALQLSTGLRVPVSIDAERGVGMNVLGGLAFAQLFGLDGTDRHGFWQVEFGVELVLDP